MLQSIVNMKLLKRASDDAGKRIVLITSEQGVGAISWCSRCLCCKEPAI